MKGFEILAVLANMLLAGYGLTAEIKGPDETDVTVPIQTRKGANMESAANKNDKISRVIPIQMRVANPLMADAVVHAEGEVDRGKEGPWSVFSRPMIINWKGAGSVTWQVEVPKADDFEIGLSYTSRNDPGPTVTVTSGNSSITDVLAKTDTGGFTEDFKGFERRKIKGKISLPKGMSEITLTLAKFSQPIMMHWMELRPQSANLAAQELKAEKSRPNMDWFVKTYGISFHWTDRSAPKQGPVMPYKEAVDKFDVNAFIDMVRETGAGHVIFTLQHGVKWCPAPIASWEEIYPGFTTQRDLIGEIAAGLAKYDIKLILYMNPHTLGTPDPGYFHFWEAQNYPFLPELNGQGKTFFKQQMKIMEEIGGRYKKNLAGYVFDGCFEMYLRCYDYPFEEFYKACKKGNPKRIISHNYWIWPVYTEWMDYFAGEGFGPGSGIENCKRYLTAGPAKGLQAHGWFIIDAPWGHYRPNTPMEPPIYDNATLIRFVQKCLKNKVAVSLNVGCYQDGSIGTETLEQLKALKKAVKDGAAAPASTEKLVAEQEGLQSSAIVDAQTGDIVLESAKGRIVGSHLTYVATIDRIMCWGNPADLVKWSFIAPTSDKYSVIVTCTHGYGPAEYVVSVGDQKVSGKITNTEPNWAEFLEDVLGTVELVKDRRYDLMIQATSMPRGEPLQLRRITLRPVKESSNFNNQSIALR